MREEWRGKFQPCGKFCLLSLSVYRRARYTAFLSGPVSEAKELDAVYSVLIPMLTNMVADSMPSFTNSKDRVGWLLRGLSSLSHR